MNKSTESFHCLRKTHFGYIIIRGRYNEDSLGRGQVFVGGEDAPLQTQECLYLNLSYDSCVRIVRESTVRHVTLSLKEEPKKGQYNKN